MFEAEVYIENLGVKNNSGHLGQRLTLLMDSRELSAYVDEITRDGVNDYIISDYKSNLDIEIRYNLFEVNNFLEKLNESNWDERDIPMLNLFIKDNPNQNFNEILERLESENYTIIRMVENVEDIGRFFMEQNGYFDDVPDIVKEFFNYKEYGQQLLNDGNFLIDFDNKIAIEFFD